MDDAISGPHSDKMSSNVELPIPIATLTIGNIAPEVGDPVKIKATCTIVRTANGIAYGRLDTINDQPIEAPVIEPDPLKDELSRLEEVSQSYGALGSRA